MRVQDQVILALTIWRENRGHGVEGMQSVANVILNRAAKNATTIYAECTKRLQFSSITAPGDPELTLWPSDGDPQWLAAQQIANQAELGALNDLTNGALLYYAPHGLTPKDTAPQPYEWLDGTKIPFPASWDPTKVRPLCSIGGQMFFR